MAILQLLLPTLVITSIILFKLNHEWKGRFFKIPLWISATVLSFAIGHAAGGVMGFYAAAFCDVTLFFIFKVMKWSWSRKNAKILRQRAQLQPV